MIDIFIVLTYLLAILGIGIYQRSGKSGLRGFSKISDRARNSKLLLVATIFASSIGGGATFGVSEKVFADGLAYSYGLLLTVPIDLLIARYVVPRLHQHIGTQSIGDIMHVYYGGYGRFIGGFATIMVSLGMLAAQISVSGRIFQYIIEVDHIIGIVLSYGIVVIYTTIGGFRSVIFTNLLQFFAIIAAIPIITIVGIKSIGIGSFMSSLPMDRIDLLSNKDLQISTLSAALGFSVMNLFPTFIQRAIINKDSAATTSAIYIKTVIYALFIICVTLNGLIALHLYPQERASMSLIYLIDTIIPVGLLGIVVSGLLAAVMSTADSDLNVSSVTLIQDFLRPLWKINDQNRLLLIARITNLIIGSLAIIVAISFTSVIDTVIFFAGFWGPVILVPLVFALFGITTSKKYMVISCVFGVAAFIVCEIYGSLIFKSVFVGTIVNLLCFSLSILLKNFNRT